MHKTELPNNFGTKFHQLTKCLFSLLRKTYHITVIYYHAIIYLARTSKEGIIRLKCTIRISGVKDERPPFDVQPERLLFCPCQFVNVILLRHELSYTRRGYNPIDNFLCDVLQNQVSNSYEINFMFSIIYCRLDAFLPTFIMYVCTLLNW